MTHTDRRLTVGWDGIIERSIVTSFTHSFKVFAEQEVRIPVEQSSGEMADISQPRAKRLSSLHLCGVMKSN